MNTAPMCALALAAAASLTGCAGLQPERGRVEPAVQQLVSDDSGARITELRVRGQAQRLSVAPKMEGAPAYEIVTGPPVDNTTPSRGASGRRVWNVLTF